MGDKIHCPCFVQKYITSSEYEASAVQISQIKWISSKVTAFLVQIPFFLLLYFHHNSAGKHKFYTTKTNGQHEQVENLTNVLRQTWKIVSFKVLIKDTVQA